MTVENEGESDHFLEILENIRRKTKVGWKTQARGKHTMKPLPTNGFGPPHL